MTANVGFGGSTPGSAGTFRIWGALGCGRVKGKRPTHRHDHLRASQTTARGPSDRKQNEPLTAFAVRGSSQPSGGAEGTRTPDPLVANEVRYQLRHSPVVRQQR